MICKSCGGKIYSKNLPVCPDCAKKDSEIYLKLHNVSEEGEKKCCICTNFCNSDSVGLCRLRGSKEGIKFSIPSPNRGVLSFYEDPLPTNCCNAWFCKGSRMKGTNLAVFYYGCNFDCLFCQNWSHKLVEMGGIFGIDEMLDVAMKKRIKCICHFGGSPEPQLPFALRFSKKVLSRREIIVCWEWNGAGRKKYVLNASKLSYKSGGTVKFDLKAWNENLHKILTGRTNKYTLENFKTVCENYPEVVSATTLLVPYYVTSKEVEEIAKFIAKFDRNIPYSLLVFHPDYKLSDLPVTPVDQVKECYNSAKKYLNNVNIGNIHLLKWL